MDWISKKLSEVLVSTIESESFDSSENSPSTPDPQLDPVVPTDPIVPTGLALPYQLPSHDILRTKSLSINKKFIINCLKNTNYTAASSNCKVLKFSSEWNEHEIIKFMTNTNCRIFPKLFIFVIEIADGEWQQVASNIQDALMIFSVARPMLLQIQLISKNQVKFFSRNVSKSEFKEIKVDLIDTKLSAIDDFQDLFRLFINEQLKEFLSAEHLEKIFGLHLAVRFLRALITNADLTIVHTCFMYGTKESLLSILDAPFEDEKDDNVIDPNSLISWKHLTQENHKLLIKSEINFAGIKSSAADALLSRKHRAVEEEISLSNAVDDEFIDLILNNCSVFDNNQEFQAGRDEKLDFLFVPRRFTSTSTDARNRNFTMEELIEEVKNDHFVLISDSAGTGKSWTLKMASKVLCDQSKRKWVTYVDLKKLTKAFEEKEPNKDFETFAVKHILKLSSSFEVNIFNETYRTGKVYMLFDGYNEIAPTYVKNVFNLFQSFKFNKGNQLWIGTRSKFEEDLKVQFEIKSAYKHLSLTKHEATDLVRKIWIFNDRTSNSNSEEIFEPYKSLAERFYDQLTMTQFGSISPFVYKMAAKLSQNDKESVEKLNRFNLYNAYCNRHSSHDQLFLEAKTNQVFFRPTKLKFTETSMLVSMQQLFPTSTIFHNLSSKSITNTDYEELIKKRIMYSHNNTYFWTHETFPEFYAAKFIFENLMWRNMEIFDFLVPVIVNDAYEVVLSILIDAFNESKLLDFLPEKWSKDLVKRLVSCIDTKFQTLKVSPMTQMILLRTTNLGFKEEFLVDFLNTVKAMAGVNHLVKSLSKELSKNGKGNLMSELCSSSAVDIQRLFTFIKALSTALTAEKAFEIIINSFELILPVCIKSRQPQKLEFIWNQLMTFNGLENLKRKMIELEAEREFLVFYIHYCQNFESFRLLWTILDYIYGPKLSIKLQETFVAENFLFELAMRDDPEILEFTLNYLSNNLNESDIKELLCFKHQSWPFVLTRICSLEKLKLFWELMKNFYKDENISEILTKRDENGMILLHIIALKSSFEILDFFVTDLKKSTSNRCLKSVLSSLNADSKTFFNIFLDRKKSFEHQDWMLNLIRGIFDLHEIFVLIKHSTTDESNLLIQSIKNGCTKVVEFSWNQIEKIVMISRNSEEAEQVAEKCKEVIQKIISKMILNEEEDEILNLNWINADFTDIFSMPDVTFLAQIDESIFSAPNDLQALASCPDFYTYEKMFKLFLEKWDENEEFSVKISEIFHEKCFIHELLKNENFKVIKWTFNKIIKVLLNEDQHENTSCKQVRELLMSTSAKNENLLQTATKIENIEVHRFLWKILSEHLSPDDIKTIIENYNCHGNNLLFETAKNSSKDVFLFNWEKIFEAYEDEKFLISFLQSKNEWNRNFLHFSAQYVKDLQVHKIIWDTYCKMLPEQKIKELLKQRDLQKNSILKNYAEYSTKEIFDFMIQEFERLKLVDEINDMFERNLKEKRDVQFWLS